MRQLNGTALLRPQISYEASGIGPYKLIHKFVLFTIMFSVFAVSPFCRAQDQDASADANQNPNFDSAIEVARADMRAQKATIVTEAMLFSDKEGAAFWPVYRQYERDRESLDDGRVAVIKEYTEKYPNVSDAEAKSMAERMFQYDSRLTELKKKYFQKFNKVLPALTVTKFFQLDRRIDLLADMKIEAALPPLTDAKYFEKAK